MTISEKGHDANHTRLPHPLFPLRDSRHYSCNSSKMPRFFFTERANRALAVNGRSYNFSPVGFVAGNFHGVYQADTPESDGDLARAVERRLGVTEISQSDFDSLKKKQVATGSSVPSSDSNAKPRAVTLPVSMSPSGAKGQVVQFAPNETPPTESGLQGKLKPEDCIRIERVSPPEIFVEEKDRGGNAVEKQPKKPRLKKAA
jgi:hypothetical protein